MAQISKQPFGVTQTGQKVDLYTLRAGGHTVQVITYGGALRSWLVPGPGGARDIVLGCDTLEQYERQDKYLGALIGRVANRIGGACFDLDGHHYPLAANSGPNCLHGGFRGFDRAVWDAREVDGGLLLTHVSPDGEEGFPGTLTARVSYSLTGDGTLALDYEAVSDRDTLCSLTCHAYFNLLGHAAGTLEGHKVQIFSDAFVEIDENSTPTGALVPVAGTPFDLRRPTPLTQGLGQSHPQLALGGGYDHSFVLHHRPAAGLAPAALAAGGGLVLECMTTQPGLQLYTANYLDGEPGKGGVRYGPRSAFCLEAQGWPDAVHHEGFPSVVLRAGEVYRQRTVYWVGAR